MLTLENTKYSKQIEYAFRELLSLACIKPDAALEIYYGKKAPPDFKGLFIPESAFWDNYKTTASLPQNILVKPELVVLFGTMERPDIIAATFFMLTRYEELFVSAHDEHGRVSASTSLAYHHKFLDRPVVNEYAEYLYRKLKGIYPTLERQLKAPAFVFTHDVDKISKSRWSAILTELKNVCRLRLSGIPGIFHHLFNHLNPADTFEWLNKLEQGQGIYFFMTKSEDGYTAESAEIKSLKQTLLNYGYKIGVHPDKGEPIAPGYQLNRNHFLMFDVNKTWDVLAAAGIKEDYTLGYADSLGFRAGCCTPFKGYSLTQEKELDLTEYPLTMMDVTLYAYMKLSPATAWIEFKKYLETILRYNGVFILLWHNFALDELRWRKFYNNVVNYVHTKQEEGLINVY